MSYPEFLKLMISSCALIFPFQLGVTFDGILKRDAKIYGRVSVGTACVYVSVGHRHIDL